MKGQASVLLVLLLALLHCGCAAAPVVTTTPSTSVDPALLSRPHLVLLGSGTPNADPERQGSALAVVVRGVPYLVDAGVGLVRRAAAAKQAGVTALAPEKLGHLFLTHLHSDHTLGYPDLILSPWVLGRQQPLQVFGPTGTTLMTQQLLSAYDEDIKTRLGGLELANKRGHEVVTEEVKPGVVFKAEGLEVTAFTARHGAWKHAYGYRFRTNEATFCVSGDTAPYPEMQQHYKGCDVLVHEVYSDAGFARRKTRWQRYHATAHTSATQLGQLAAQVKPALLVLTHLLLWGSTPDQLLKEVQAHHAGRVVVGRDLTLVGLDPAQKGAARLVVRQLQ
jgi:ribonuclease BN (tRNA processing enzyme)